VFNLTRLLEEAQTVDAIDLSDVDHVSDAVLRELRGRTVKVPGRATYRYPQSPTLLEPLRQALQAELPVGTEFGLPAVRQLLGQPLRVFPEEAVNAPNARTFVGAYLIPAQEDPFILAARLQDLDPMSVELSFGTLETAADLLAEIYLRTERNARIILPGPRRAPRLAWVGGSVDEGDAPPGWHEVIEAAGAVRGVVTRVFEQPYRQFKAVRMELHDLAPAVAVIWLPYAGDSSGWSDIGTPDRNLTIIETGEIRFEDALLDATMQIDSRSMPAAPDESPDAPRPAAGEVRIYKKHYATPSRDVLLEANDCGHNAWQPAGKAPKAEKGIEKASNGGLIDSMEKCVRCTGGGRWRVTFG
jgi:hypothetical protein